MEADRNNLFTDFISPNGCKQLGQTKARSQEPHLVLPDGGKKKQGVGSEVEQLDFSQHSIMGFKGPER